MGKSTGVSFRVGDLLRKKNVARLMSAQMRYAALLIIGVLLAIIVFHPVVAQDDSDALLQTLLADDFDTEAPAEIDAVEPAEPAPAAPVDESDVDFGALMGIEPEPEKGADDDMGFDEPAFGAANEADEWGMDEPGAFDEPFAPEAEVPTEPAPAEGHSLNGGNGPFEEEETLFGDVDEDAGVMKPTPLTDDMEDLRKILTSDFGEPSGEGMAPPRATGFVTGPGRRLVRGPKLEVEAETLEGPEAEAMIRQTAVEIQGMHDLELAEKALMERSYQTALHHFLNAEAHLPKRLETADALRRANDGAMIAQYYLALELLDKGDLTGEEGALVLAQRALARNRKFLGAERLVERIEARITEQQAVAERDSVRRRVAQDYQDKRQRAELWIRKADEHERVDEFKEAAESLKMVLAIDPSNDSAINRLKSIQNRRFRRETSERDAMSRERIADVRDTWNPRDYQHYLPEDGGPAQATTTVITKRPEDELRQKMESIRIPEIQFREANIKDVVEFLVEASRAADKSTQDELARGVNIILNIGEDAEKTVSFQARYVTLLDAIKIITEVANLKYRIEKNVVMIIPLDAPGGTIVTRFYPVDPTIIARLRSDAATASGGGGGGGFITLDQQSLDTDTGDLKVYFEGLGVPFPVGSSISYNSSIGKLIVANTEGNLAGFERVLQELNVVQPQVEIETRFVDIAQTDLEELGLEWLLTDDMEVATKKGATGALNARPRMLIRENATTGGFTKNIRYNSLGIGATAGTGSGSSGIMTFQSVLTNPELALILHAIEQSGHADLLSAPKVTTQPGLEATVRIVTEYIYPTEYRVIQGALAGGAAGVGYIGTIPTVVVPDSFETREVGVILTVLPELSQGNSIIQLTLAPEVVTPPEWHDYGYELADGTPIPMFMPFFHARSVSTTVKVYNGATVVMGGLISEDRNTTDDRIPFLGSLPLIGNLFRGTQKSSAKRNLLIFVTARLVDPSGKAIPVGKEPMTAGAAENP